MKKMMKMLKAVRHLWNKIEQLILTFNGYK